MLNPTILASQTEELHPHLIHHQPDPRQPHHHPNPHLQSHLRHNDRIRQRVQGYHQYAPQSDSQELYQLDEQVVRGRSGTVEVGFFRKRSLSVPLLLSLNQQQQEQESHSSRAPEAVAHSRSRGREQDGDQDMETDDIDDPSVARTAASRAESSRTTVIDYSKLRMPRESLLATVSRPHRHRVYAGGGAHSLHYNHHNQHPHYYTLRHHLSYNPFKYRKFPPFQYWAASAQRDYHLSTIGVVGGHGSGARTAALASSEDREGSGVGGLAPGAGDPVLRGSVSNGGVTKTHYRSRLPVHLRHMTSRTNRRAAICADPFQGVPDSSLTTQYQGYQDSAHRGQHNGVLDDDVTSGVLLSSLSIGGMSTPGMQSISRPLAATPVGSNGGLGAPSSSSSQSPSLSEWNKVMTMHHGLVEDEGQYAGSSTACANNDRATLKTSGGSSSGARGKNVREWLKQTGALANVLYSKEDAAGPGSSGAGGSKGTVDRLIEEMNKWSV
ncbi:hypothetical protein BGZ58_000326 [Dissophora ornata]|nr:hypothetical protein BGZ58_000326 [Dissophora ornata]